MDETIEVRQTGTMDTLFVEPFHAQGWHKTDASGGTGVQLRTQSTLWSFGSIDVNEIGSAVLLLPSANRAVASNLRLIVAHVEV